MKILGISAFYHDSAAALIHEGRVIAAAQEERWTRIKHDARYPKSMLDIVSKTKSQEATTMTSYPTTQVQDEFLKAIEQQWEHR